MVHVNEIHRLYREVLSEVKQEAKSSGFYEHVDALNQVVDDVVKEITLEKHHILPKEFDLVVSAGSYRIFYGLGMVKVIQALERENLFTIKRY